MHSNLRNAKDGEAPRTTGVDVAVIVSNPRNTMPLRRKVIAIAAATAAFVVLAVAAAGLNGVELKTGVQHSDTSINESINDTGR